MPKVCKSVFLNIFQMNAISLQIIGYFFLLLFFSSSFFWGGGGGGGGSIALIHHSMGLGAFRLIFL